MNQAIVRVAAVIVVLFGGLVAFTSRWTVFEAGALRDNSLNRRSLIREQLIPRGTIVAADGRTVLARSVSRRSRGDAAVGERVYARRYPTAELFAHTIGYSSIRFGRSGVERSYNDELTGRKEEILTVADELLGRRREGSDLVTALDPRAQRVAADALAAAPGNGRGSVVVIEPASGAVRVMVSLPSYDPNRLDGRRIAALNRDSERAPLVNRATQSLYPPGSTFKIVTAAAALDSGRFTPSSRVSGDSPREISGRPLRNFGDRDFGRVTLTQALTYSVNTAWAATAERLGPGTLYAYMRRFGFDADPPIGLPGDQLAASGVYDNGQLLGPDDGVDIGRVGIGQERLLVTPLQMASVAATIANRGVRMRPRLVVEVRDRDGRLVERIRPDKVRRVMSQESAGELAEMMRTVVDEGTGRAASLLGERVAGKTGTAEVSGELPNQAWFVGFAPAERPRYAIAVTVERTAGQGGTVAAPIAAKVLRELLAAR